MDLGLPGFRPSLPFINKPFPRDEPWSLFVDRGFLGDPQVQLIAFKQHAEAALDQCNSPRSRCTFKQLSGAVGDGTLGQPGSPCQR